MAAPRELPTGARVGTWIGIFGWLIGFALVTIPDTPRFAGPLAGGFGVTLLAALGVDVTARHAPRFRLAVWGALLVGLGAICLYYSLVVEPAVLAAPDVLSRLHRLGASTHMPVWIGPVAMVVGLPLLLAAWIRPKGGPGSRG